MKLKKWLPLLILALVLVYFLLPGGEGTVPTSAPEPRQTAELSLLSPAPEPTAEAEPEAPAESAAPAESETPAAEPSAPEAAEEPELLDEDGSYTSKEDVALYVHTYGHLPSNFIPKKQAEAAGWQGGPLDKVLPGMSIGGDYFGNYEGKLPKAKGRQWTECDLNTLGARTRGAERLIFSNDGLIYYTPDHYESFELLYD